MFGFRYLPWMKMRQMALVVRFLSHPLLGRDKEGRSYVPWSTTATDSLAAPLTNKGYIHLTTSMHSRWKT